MERKILPIIAFFALTNMFSSVESSCSPIENSVIKIVSNESRVMGDFFEEGYQEKQTLPELIEYLTEEWNSIINDLSEKNVRLTDKTNIFRLFGIFGFNAPRIWRYGNLGGRNLEKLGYERRSYILEEGTYALELERKIPQELQHRFIRLEFNLENYPETKNHIAKDIKTYLENPSLETLVNPFERETYSKNDWVHRIIFYN